MSTSIFELFITGVQITCSQRYRVLRKGTSREDKEYQDIIQKLPETIMYLIVDDEQ